MGRTTSEPQKETPTAITHFGHPHPLIHITTDHQHKITRNISSYSSCSGCNLNIFGTNFYTCIDCKFSLHKKCFDMPKKIEHPFHKDHALSLVPGPAYSTGNFNCDACFEKGKGFSYNCDPCGIDLHILCAIMPLCVTNATCHPHKLDLTFGSPFLTKRFNCNVCKKLGGDHWLYRCGLCGFDAHLKCVMSFQSKDYLEPREVATFSRWDPATPPLVVVAPPPVVPALPLMVAPPPLVEKVPPSMVAPTPPNVATPPPIVAVLPSVMAVPPDLTQKLRAHPVMESAPCVLPVEVSSVPSTRVGNGHNNDLALFAIQQMITNNSKAIAQAILSAGDSGDIRGFHLLIELIYAISSNSGTSGGSSQDSLHTTKNNGGGSDGKDSLHMVIDCGGDGGGEGHALHTVIEDSGGVGGQKSLHAVNDDSGGQESSQEVMGDGCDAGGGRDSLPAIKIDGGGSGDQESLQAVVREHSGGQDYLQTVMEIGGGGGGYLPEKITHPFDEKHALTLLLEPAYGEGRFQCDACSERGKGYSYHCQPCGIDLHVHCAMLPLSVTHSSHVHKLNLTFESPYPEKKFSCDICTSIGSCQWLYTCKSCGFDAHVKCATTEDDSPPAHTPSKSIEPTKRRQEASAAPMTKMGFPEAQVSVNVPRFGVGRQNSGLTAIQQMKINDNRANTTMAQGLMGLVRISNSVISGDGGYQQSLIGDGNGINFLAGLFEG